MKTFITGPSYARRLVDGADRRRRRHPHQRHGHRLGRATPPGGDLTAGPQRVDARAVILATGARERPRPARMIPGRPVARASTPPDTLQNLVHLQHRRVGRRAVVVGAELVSYSAVLTLKHAGCETVLMTTTYPSPESYAVFNVAGTIAAARRRGRHPHPGRHASSASPRCAAVEIENLDTGARRIVECDTLVLTGDWIPDHELARSARTGHGPGNPWPADRSLRCAPVGRGVFAIGNLLHPVDTADIAALDGRHVAGPVRELPPRCACGRRRRAASGRRAPSVDLTRRHPARRRRRRRAIAS